MKKVGEPPTILKFCSVLVREYRFETPDRSLERVQGKQFPLDRILAGGGQSAGCCPIGQYRAPHSPMLIAFRIYVRSNIVVREVRESSVA